ncbi:MAG: hypothetical protein KGN77_13680 [Xanthomonadaceae bacterium]|nr:hypothetical protein [Xanthomonadaceae bacterium]MDE1965325.1 hypothetical protein [Xanthomonadaceae bacterium]
MNPIDDDTLHAYVDGQLDPAQAARVDAAMATDPVLSARVTRERALLAALRGQFDPVLDERVPERLTALLREPSDAGATAGAGGSATVVSLPTPRSGRARRRWIVPAALAASVALAAMLFRHAPVPSLVRTQGGQSFAAGDLRRALDTELASAPDPDAGTAIGLTFRTGDGAICRTFVHRAGPALAGLACRRGDAWALPVLTSPTREPAGPIRPAASALPPAVQAAVDARIQGDAFDADQERAARAAGWR